MAVELTLGKPTKAVKEYLGANPITSGAIHASLRWKGVETVSFSQNGEVVSVATLARKWRELRFHGDCAVGLLNLLDSLPPGKWDLFDFPTHLAKRLEGHGKVNVEEPADLFKYAKGTAPEAPLKPGYRLSSLRPEHTELVHKRWGLNPDGDMIPFFRKRIREGPTAAVYEGTRPVAWAGTYHETPWVVQTGYLYVEPEHRRKGLGSSVTSSLLNKILAKGKTPMAHVWETNIASQGFVRSYGFEPVAKRFWGDIVLE